MESPSLGFELTELARTNHSQFLELGEDLLRLVGNDNKRVFGRWNFDLPMQEDGSLNIVKSEIIRLFNHILAFLVSKLSVEGQEKVGLFALGIELNHDVIIEKWALYRREFGTNTFIANKIREVASLRDREGNGRSGTAHKKAAYIIANSPDLITSGHEARKLKGVGEKIAAKVDELLSSGKIAILEVQMEVEKVIKTFMTIWGVNVATARFWYEQNYRSVEEIRIASQTGNIKLTKLQTMGLQYYEDFQVLMGARVVKTVGDLVKVASGNRLTMIVGSYRRKVYDPVFKIKRPIREISEFQTKDVDILIVDNEKRVGSLREIVTLLQKVTDFQIAAIGEHMCMGCIFVPSLKRYKRVDIFLCVEDELPCALLAHTGPALYNVHMREVAKEKGWTLNEHHLYNEKDEIIQVQTEADVQRLLGFPEDFPYDRK